jgi:hypothetical protein
MRREETTAPRQNQVLRRAGQWEPNLIMLRLNLSVIQRTCSGLICKP